MRTHYTYWFEGGAIWRAALCGEFRVREEIHPVTRDEAIQILADHAESATSGNWRSPVAADLRDEMAEAIRQHDEFHQQKAA